MREERYKRKKRIFPKTAIGILAILLLCGGCVSMRNTTLPPQPGAEEYLGTISVEGVEWNWLFKEDLESSERELTALALAKAAEIYGEGIVLRNVEYTAIWSPKSFLMVFHLAGFARTTRVTAAVYRPVPPPAPPAPPPPPEPSVEYRYIVIPENRYADSQGYTGILYRDAETIKEELILAFDRGTITADERDEGIAEVHAGGMITVLIGRRENEDANPRNYTYIVTYPGKTPSKKRGHDLIPNIPGREGFWWNEDVINLDAPILDEVTIVVIDAKTKREYQFIIRRVVKED